jgi:hypothetical protein
MDDCKIPFVLVLLGYGILCEEAEETKVWASSLLDLRKASIG